MLRSLAILAAAIALATLPGPARATPHALVLTAGYTYLPGDAEGSAPLRVWEGGSVRYANADVDWHTVTATRVDPDGMPLFETPLIGPGQTVLVAGAEALAPGTYPFTCRIHGGDGDTGMHGLLEVVADP